MRKNVVQQKDFYLANSEEELLKAVARLQKLGKDKIEIKKDYNNRIEQEKMDQLRSTKLHGQFERDYVEHMWGIFCTCLNIHWALCKEYGVKVFERWYEHKVESVIENDIVKVLWDVCIQVNRQIEHWRPDIVVMEKNTNKCSIIDVACPVDNNLILKRNEKLDN